MKVKLFLIFATLATATTAATEATLEDICPSLPMEISLKEPSYENFVTVKAQDARWLEQYEKYNQAVEQFESEYSVELKLVESQWEKLEKNYYPSQMRFYELFTTEEDEGLFAEVKSLCWSEVMKINEMEKDNLCHPLEQPPTSKQWNQILVCSVERANLLEIELL